MPKEYRPRWTVLPYVLVHLIGLVLIPGVVAAGSGHEIARSLAWEIIVICSIVVAPIGAWLGAVTPPPEGYEKEVGHWTFSQQFVGGSVAGWIASGIAGQYVTGTNPLLVAAAFFSAFGGAGLLILIRGQYFKRITRGEGEP